MEPTQRRFLVHFKGLPKGWAGVPGHYSLTVSGASEKEAIASLFPRYQVEKTLKVRELGVRKQK